MNEQEAIAVMIAPGTRRPGKYREGVIQIWVTRACDKACYGCTQGSNLGGKPGMITVEQFEKAVISLKGYFGVVGVFGGNPAVHPKFDELCEVLADHIPFEQRGLWCNNLMGKGVVARQTFNPKVSNLNVHLDREAFIEFKRDWPESMPVGLTTDSRHSPPFVAIQDVIKDPEEQWELISGCDINKHWSAMIGVFRGEVRAWFCEIAGAQSMLHQHEEDYPDTGMVVTSDWWQKPLSDFANQVRKHCPACGVPLRGYGELSQKEDGIEQVSLTHIGVYNPKTKNREVQVVTEREELGKKSLGRFTDYLQNSKV